MCLQKLKFYFLVKISFQLQSKILMFGIIFKQTRNLTLISVIWFIKNYNQLGYVKKYIRVVIFMFLGMNFSFAQKSISNFEVSLEGKTVGLMVATKEINGDLISYSLHSDVETKIFRMSLEVESELDMVTKNQILIEGKSFQYSNRGSDNISATVIKLVDNTYQTNKNNKSKILKVDKIVDTVTDLYYKEPKGITSVFSIADADFLDIESIGNGSYALILPNGRKNIFTYLNGNFENMQAPILVGVVQITRKP